MLVKALKGSDTRYAIKRSGPADGADVQALRAVQAGAPAGTGKAQ